MVTKQAPKILTQVEDKLLLISVQSSSVYRKLWSLGFIGEAINNEQLISESTKHRNTRKFNSVLTRKMSVAAKELKENKDIIIRKANKSNTYVILNKDIYESKLKKIK